MNTLVIWLLAGFHVLVLHANAVVGFAVPPIVEFLSTKIYNEIERLLMTFLVCFFAAVLLNWQQLTSTQPEQVFLWMGLVFMESQAVFKLYFKNSAMRQTIRSTFKAVPLVPEPNQPTYIPPTMP